MTDAGGTRPLVSVGIVCWNSAEDIGACVDAVRRQDYRPIELLVADNDSRDHTWTRLEALTTPAERTQLGRNTGFAAAHNHLIARSRGEFYLCLNPDVALEPSFVSALAAAMAARPDAGSATGLLLRRDAPDVVDSTGIVMTASQRHLDRGADRPLSREHTRPDDVFGASGAAAFYRRSMLDDTRVLGEYFDEDFFAYREDADLAWRAQLLGWRCLYVPEARARHGRRVTPERRASLPPDVNRYSVRNRILLRLKNQTLGHALRFAWPALVRDAQVVGFVCLREHRSLPGLIDVVRLMPRMWRKRRSIQARRRASGRAMAAWFRPDRVVETGEPSSPTSRGA